jgi:hypothetical protein
MIGDDRCQETASLYCLADYHLPQRCTDSGWARGGYPHEVMVAEKLSRNGPCLVEDRSVAPSRQPLLGETSYMQKRLIRIHEVL